MDKILNFFDGKKTNLTLIVIGIVELLVQFDFLDSEVGNAAIVLLGALAGVFLRMGVQKARNEKIIEVKKK